MDEEQYDLIHDAAEKFAEAIKGQVGGDARVGVFYCYLDDGNWISGNSGNSNWLERIGMLKFLLRLEEGGKKF